MGILLRWISFAQGTFKVAIDIFCSDIAETILDISYDYVLSKKKHLNVTY